jgi:hypothetical protein
MYSNGLDKGKENNRKIGQWSSTGQGKHCDSLSGLQEYLHRSGTGKIEEYKNKCQRFFLPSSFLHVL